MEFLRISPESIKLAADIIRNGGLVAFPTETVYGLGADAYNPQALAKIFEVKKRPRFDPLIIHIAAVEKLEDAADLSLLSKETRFKLFTLTKNLWPGPLSIVLPKNKKIPGIATAGLSTVAIRFPEHEAARDLISLSSTAVAAPSANPFGCLSPTKAEHVRDYFGEKIDMILDGGTARIGLESTVLDITGDCIKILRPGGMPKETIERLIGAVYNGFSDEKSESAQEKGLVSPGQLKSHYAPKTPLSVFEKEEIIRLVYEKGTAFLFFSSHTRDAWLQGRKSPADAVIRTLSESGNLTEAAACLFETLHEIDKCDCSRIYAEAAPAQGLGEAINDRLKRASVTRPIMHG
jgi:L-threonylcarbamoyladenylate synthase